MELSGDLKDFISNSKLSQENILNIIFDNLKQSIAVVNTNMEILYVNKKAKDNAREIDGNELKYGNSLWNLLPKEKGGAANRVLEKVYSGESVDVILKHKTLKKTFLWFNYSFIPIVRKDKKVEFIIINGIDITQQKHADMKIRESEAKYKAIVQLQAEMICKFTITGTITFVNSAYCKFFDVSEKKIVGTNFFHRIPKPMREKVKSDLMKLSPTNPHLYYVERFTGNKDISRWISGTNSAVFDNDGNIIEIQLVGKDITEQKIMQEELLKAKEKAEESDRIKSVFLANMSHEIRTPLNGILGFSSLLASSSVDKEKVEEYCNLIEESGNQLLVIMDDILEISLIETNQLSLYNTIVYLPGTINNLYDYIIDTLSSNIKDIRIKKSIPLKGPNFFYTDGIRLYQVFTKLLNNALKFCHSGCIEFGYYQSKYNMVRFFVRDTGIGIPPEKQEVIFEPFRQADESSNRIFGGNGLGLAIAKALVENMGGRLCVESKIDIGSNFFFDLPIVDTVGSRRKKEGKPMVEKEYRWDGRKILIVEDTHLNFILLREFIKKTSALVIPANTGSVALEILEKTDDIDLVLLDIRLPDINGYEIARKIKNMNSKIPVIFQTAYSTDCDKSEASKAGCDGFLVKPITKDLLLRTIDSFFNAVDNPPKI